MFLKLDFLAHIYINLKRARRFYSPLCFPGLSYHSFYVYRCECFRIIWWSYCTLQDPIGPKSMKHIREGGGFIRSLVGNFQYGSEKWLYLKYSICVCMYEYMFVWLYLCITSTICLYKEGFLSNPLEFPNIVWISYMRSIVRVEITLFNLRSLEQQSADPWAKWAIWRIV